MTNEQLKKELQIIANTEENTIEKQVALEALNHYESEIEVCFSNILNYGYEMGMVGSFIYYTDTRNFFDEHYFQIEELREEYEENTGIPIQVNGDLKTSLAWFSFQKVTRRLADKFELEV